MIRPMAARLKTGLWVKALIRRCDLAAVGVAVVARGDPDGGAVLLKFNGRDAGCRVLTQARGPEGALVWISATGAVPVAEAEADSYVARQRRYDADLWVVEIETSAAESVIDGPIL